MNKKVLRAMIILCTAFLLGLYALKFIFPEQFVLKTENSVILSISAFIDGNKILYYAFGGVTAFITYWLYCCACTHRLWLKPLYCVMITAVVVAVRVISFFDTNVSTAISVCSFIFLPALMKGDIKTCAIVYTVHGVNQCLTLSIRGLLTYATYLGSLNILLLSIDMYIWLLLFYAIFNYKSKKEVQ